MAETMEKKSTRVFKQVSFEIFKNAAAKLGLQWADLAEALGYSRTAHLKWEEDKRLPAVAALACEALIRRHGNSAKGDVRYQLLKTYFTGTHVTSEIVAIEGEMQTMTIGGINYVMFEVRK